MPSFLRLALRLLSGTLLIAVLAFTATATANAAVTVSIQPPGDDDPRSISTDAVEPDINGQSFRIAGRSQRVEVAKGVSLLALLRETQTNFGYATIQVPRPDGTTLELTQEQVEDDPRNQVVFYTDEQGVSHFIGPRQGNGVVPAKDYFAVGGGIVLVQQAESRLKVTISPSKKKIELGGTLTFRAKVTGDEPGETVVYSWWLAGKSPRRGADEHVQDFPEKDGVYKVSVAARIEGSGVSDTAVARITVGDPAKADREQTGSGDQSTGSDGGAGTGTGSGGSSGYSPTYTPTQAPPASPSPPIPTPEPADPPDLATSGTTVEGNLLAAASDPPPSNILESAARAARAGRQSDDAADGAGVPEAALSIAGVLALLGLGAGIENRQGRLPRPRLRLPKLALPRRGA